MFLGSFFFYCTFCVLSKSFQHFLKYFQFSIKCYFLASVTLLGYSIYRFVIQFSNRCNSVDQFLTFPLEGSTFHRDNLLNLWIVFLL